MGRNNKLLKRLLARPKDFTYDRSDMMKNLMEYKGYFAKIEYSANDEVFFGTIEGINDTISFEGASTKELKAAFHEAVEDYLDMCQRYGKEPHKTYRGSFNVRIDPEIHKKAAILAASKGTSLNKFVESAIADKIQEL